MIGFIRVKIPRVKGITRFCFALVFNHFTMPDDHADKIPSGIVVSDLWNAATAVPVIRSGHNRGCSKPDRL